MWNTALEQTMISLSGRGAFSASAGSSRWVRRPGGCRSTTYGSAVHRSPSTYRRTVAVGSPKEKGPMPRSRARHVTVLAWMLAAAPYLISCTTPAALDRPPAAAQLEEDIDDYLERHLLTDVRAVIVVADDRTIVEEYFDATAEDYRSVFSVTKSVVSTLVGIAVDEGLLALDQTLVDLLPAYAATMTPDVAGTTLEQLLTMTGGFRDTWSGPSVVERARPSTRLDRVRPAERGPPAGTAASPTPTPEWTWSPRSWPRRPGSRFCSTRGTSCSPLSASTPSRRPSRWPSPATSTSTRRPGSRGRSTPKESISARRC